MDNQINVTVENGVKELVIREGAAQELFNPNQVILSGTIDAPQDYWELRQANHPKDKSYVLYSADKKYVNLRVDEKDKLGTSVNGGLYENPDLVALGINSGKGYTLTDLRNKLKFMRTFFKELDAYSTLMGNLGKFSASVQSQIEKETSERGNKKEHWEVKVDSNLALDFVLSMPLFKGQPKKEFKVDICFDIREKNVDVWMESVELKDLQINEAARLIGEQVLYFNDAGIVTIEQ